MPIERIQKVMAEQGLCSRRAAEMIIEEGRVKLNGHPVRLGDKMDTARDVLTVDGERIYIDREQAMYYLALHKPRGYVTTASDELGRKTVMDLVADVPARLFPVGRLDKDSEGLLLMTNDGAFANLMMHPSGGISKLYRVTVRPRAEEYQIIEMSQGVVLDDGVRTAPCVINVVVDEPGRTVMEITLKEGRNRQIRRMCEAVGLEVVRLKRSAEGCVKLGMLQPGQYRELTKQELSGLRAAAVKGRDRSRTMRAQEAAEARRHPAPPPPRKPAPMDGPGRPARKPAGPAKAARAPRADRFDEPARYGKPAGRAPSAGRSTGRTGEGRGPAGGSRSAGGKNRGPGGGTRGPGGRGR